MENGSKVFWKQTLSRTIAALASGIIITLVMGSLYYVVDRLGDPVWLRAVLTVAYAALLAVILPLAFLCTKPREVWRMTSLVILCVITAFYFLWVGTWISAPEESRPEEVVPKDSDLYASFDEFDGYGAPDASRWTSFPSGTEELCSAEQHYDYLWMKCERSGTQQYIPQWSQDESVLGIAASGGVLCTSRYAWLELAAGFSSADSGQQDEPTHVYFLGLQPESARVVECDTQDWENCPTLAQFRVEPLQQHVLQIEYDEGELSFYVDGQPVQLKDEHRLPHGSTWRTWYIQGSVVGQEEGECAVLESYVDWVTIRRGS